MLSLHRRSFLTACAAAPALAAQSKNETLLRAIPQRLAGFEGQVFLYAKNLDSGAEFGLHADERVRTASTITVSYTHLDVYKRQASCWAGTASATRRSSSGTP